MKNEHPRVSIGLPVFNGEKYLARSLESLLEQEYEDFEVVISDNASTDSTGDICKKFAARDARIRYYRNEENVGASRNFNNVFHLAKGEFFKWAPHDDECHPSLIRRCVETFDRLPESTVLVHSGADLIDAVGKKICVSPDRVSATSCDAHRRFSNVIFNTSYVHPLWGVIRSSALRKTRLIGNHEADHVLLAELALLGTFVEIKDCLYGLRRHERNATVINHSGRELLAWHDPRLANTRILLPHWERVYVEYFKSVHHIRLSLRERFLCYACILPVVYWRRVLKFTGPLRARLGLSRGNRRSHVKDDVNETLSLRL